MSKKFCQKRGLSFLVVAAKLFVEKYCNLGEKLENLVAIKVHFLFILLTLPEKKFTCVQNIQLFPGWVYKMSNISQNKRN